MGGHNLPVEIGLTYLNLGKAAASLPALPLIMSLILTMPERIYNPITAMGFLAMFTFQLDSTKR